MQIARTNEKILDFHWQALRCKTLIYVTIGGHAINCAMPPPLLKYIMKGINFEFDPQNRIEPYSVNNDAWNNV
jgi:hypothetical protein